MKHGELYLPLLSACWLITICHSGIAPPPPPPPIPIQPSTDYPSQVNNGEIANNSTPVNNEVVSENISNLTIQEITDKVVDSSKSESNETFGATSSQSDLAQNDTAAVTLGGNGTMDYTSISTSNDSVAEDIVLATNASVRDTGTDLGKSISKAPLIFNNDTYLSDQLVSSDTISNITDNITVSAPDTNLQLSNDTQTFSDNVMPPQINFNISETVSDVMDDRLSGPNQTLTGIGYDQPLQQNASTSEMALSDTSFETNQTVSSDNTSSLLLTDLTKQPPITFSEQNGSTTVEFSPTQFDNITLTDFGIISQYETVNNLHNLSTGTNFTDVDIPLVDENKTERVMSSNDTTPAVLSLNETLGLFENVTDSQQKELSTQAETIFTIKATTITTTNPVTVVSGPARPIEDRVAIDHPPPIFLDGRRPPVYTDSSSIQSQQYVPDSQIVPSKQRPQPTEPPAPPPIFVPRRQTRPVYRIITTTTSSPPYRPVFTQVQTLRPENDPRYMTVAELAELALRKRNEKKTRKADLVFFNTIQPLTPEPIVSTTQTPFNKRPDVVYQPYQIQTLPTPAPIAEPPKQFFDANYLLNQIASQQQKRPISQDTKDNPDNMKLSQQPNTSQDRQFPQNQQQFRKHQTEKQPFQESMLQNEPIQSVPDSLSNFKQLTKMQQPVVQSSKPSDPTKGLGAQSFVPDQLDRQFGSKQSQGTTQTIQHVQQPERSQRLKEQIRQLPLNVQQTMSDIGTNQQRLQLQEQRKASSQNEIVSPSQQFIGLSQDQTQAPNIPLFTKLGQQPQQDQQQKIQQLIDDLEQQQEQLRRIQKSLQQRSSNQGRPAQPKRINEQTVTPSQKTFFNSEYLLRQIGIGPNEGAGGPKEASTPQVKTSSSSNSIHKSQVNQPRKIANQASIPTAPLFPKTQHMVQKTQTKPEVQKHRNRLKTRRLQDKESPFTPFVNMNDLFSSQALEAWIKTMAIKPEILHQVQNENRNKVNNGVKLNRQQPTFPGVVPLSPVTNPSSVKQPDINQRQGSAEKVPSAPRPTFQHISTVTTRQFERFTPRPTVPKLSVRKDFNRRSRNFQPNTVTRPVPQFSLPRPRQHVYGDASTNNVGDASVINTNNAANNQIPVIGWNDQGHNNPNLRRRQLHNMVNPVKSQLHNGRNRGNNQLHGTPNQANNQQHNSVNGRNGRLNANPIGAQNRRHDSPMQNSIVTRIERSSPETIPKLPMPSQNHNPSSNQLQPNRDKNNLIQQFPLAQQLGFTNVMDEHNSGLNNMNLNEINQINFQPNIITNTGTRSRMIPARTLEDMKSHWSSKAGNSIKLPVEQLPYFLRTATEPVGNERPAQIQFISNEEMNTPVMPYRITTISSIPVLMKRFTTTTTPPTVPPTVDPNPPAIFDTKMLKTFMPMPKQDFTTRPTINKMKYQGEKTTGNTSIPGFDDRCINCTFVNQRCLLPDPVHCNMFIECVIQGSAVRGFNRECALGSFFDRKSYLCVDPKNTDCPQDRCREPGLKWYPIHGHCKHYWSCASREGGGIFAQSECCPDMGGFDEDLGCVENRNCTESCDSAIVTASTSGCHLRKTSSPKIYFDNNANIERPCAPGTLFNEQKCTCEQDISIERSENRPGATSCLPMLNITFDNNIIVDVSLNKQHIGEEGVSTTPSGEGIFNGVGRLILWRYANLMFPVVFAVRFRFETASSGPRFQTVISNCDPKGGREPTFDITLDTRFREVIFRVDTLENPTRIFKETYQHTKDTTVVLIYDGERIVGSVDNRARNIIARGGIETRPNPISIGACGGKEGFNGLLDDLTIFEECIPDDMYGIFMSVLE